MQSISLLMVGMVAIQLIITAFLSITFIESSLNKLLSYGSTREYFENQFKSSILRSSVGIMLPVITFFETATALLSTVGFILILMGNSFVAFVAAILAMVTFLMLYFGLRVSKDYAGASGMVSYIIMDTIAIFFLVL